MSRMKNRKVGASVATLLLAIFLPFAFAQSGRQPQQPQQTPPRPPAAPKPSPKATEAPAQDSRPRRTTDEPQDEGPPLKLSADLVTVITSVTDAAGNQINDLAQNDFQIYEDNQPQ